MTTTIDSELTTAIEAIIDRHGEPARSRAEAGVARVASYWTTQDGDQDLSLIHI